MDCLASNNEFKSLIDLVAADDGELTPSAPTDLGPCIADDK
jgi:hypothetical protein